MLKPLPKRSYDLTQEELDAAVQADVKRQIGPKRPPPKEIIPAEKVDRCLKNLRREPPQLPDLPDDYDRCIKKIISEEQHEKEAAYRRKREQMQTAISEEQQEKEAAYRLKREQMRTAKSGKQVAQLGEQANQSIPPLKVMPDKEVHHDTFRIDDPTEYQYAWTYVYGRSLVRPEKVESLTTQLRRLHQWYEKAAKAGHDVFWVKYRKEHYFTDDAMYIPFSEIFQLFNQDALDKSIISCYCL